MRRVRRQLATLLCLAVLLQLPWASSAIPAANAQGMAAASVTSADLTCVTIVSDSLAFAAGASGTIIKSTNGGDTWTQVGPGGTKTFTGIAFWNATNGLAVTRDRSVWYTTNGGGTWTQSTPDMNSSAYGAVYLRIVNALAVVPGTSSDACLVGGTPRTESTIFFGEQVWRTGNSTGIYWGKEPLPWSGKYYNEPDEFGEPFWGGKGEFRSIDFGSSTHGWAVGVDHYNPADAATVYASTDGGTFWNRQTFSSALDLTGVSAASSTVAVITSSAGRIFRTSNGGSSWVEASTVPSPLVALNSVALSDASNGWAVGAGGALLRTTDGGDTWTSVGSPTYQELSAVAVSGTGAIAVGKSGTVVLTDDGVSWRSAGAADITPPVTTLNAPSADGTGGWYKTAPQITLTTEAGASKYYSWDSDPQDAYAARSPRHGHAHAALSLGRRRREIPRPTRPRSSRSNWTHQRRPRSRLAP